MADDDWVATKMRLLRYYPAITLPDTLLPLCWNYRDKNNCIGLSTKNLRVHYKGLGKRSKDAASVRANRSIPIIAGAYYFEVRVISKGREGHIGVGVSSDNAQLTKLPGWERDSFGYHADDGNLFCGSGTGQPYGPTYTTGDVVGCCVNFTDKLVFFTKNGIPLGSASRSLPNSALPLFPTVGLQTSGEVIEANFGQNPFMFDFENYLKELRSRTRSEILAHPVSTTGSLSGNVRGLVLSYLCCAGYAATAQAFSRATGLALPEHLNNVKSRQHLQNLILSGLMGEAIDYINETSPDLLNSKPRLRFTLKCQQFIEAVRIYATQTNSESNNTAWSQNNDEMDGSGHTSSDGDSAPVKPKNGHSGVTLDSLLALGREVFTLSEELSKFEGGQSFLSQRGDVLSLIACSDPSNSPLLSIEHRHNAWYAVSRALLETQLPPGTAGLAPLELLTAHSRQLAATLSQHQSPSIAHLPLESFFYPREPMSASGDSRNDLTSSS